ncbi:MAG: pirin family protein [Coxiellaceae bacterium]|nr:pirin family protein [Coxiellaceae bacterium]
MIKIIKVARAVQIPIEANDKKIFRVIGTTDVDGKGTEHEVHAVDPFIFLDEAIMNDSGTTFSPHPHAGLAAISYILKGEIQAWDNLNGYNQDHNQAGGAFYINAGRGVVHSESGVNVEDNLHWLQLWLNPGIYADRLPQASAQLFSPREIPVHKSDGLTARIIAGELFGVSSSLQADWPITYAHISLEPGVSKSISMSNKNWNGFVYVLSGEGQFGSENVAATYQQCLMFNTCESTELSIINTSDSSLDFMLAVGKPHEKGFAKLLGHGGAIVADNEARARDAMRHYESNPDDFGKV